MLELSAIDTLALAGGTLLATSIACRAWRPLRRFNLPPAVVGGLAVSMVLFVGRSHTTTLIHLDTAPQASLMMGFFASIGFSASVPLLRAGGPQVLLMLLLAGVLAVLQNVVGLIGAVLFGLPPLFGVLAGSVTLAGGPATGLAFAPLFEQAGISGAASAAMATAMAGIIVGSIIGGPLGAYLIRRHALERAASGAGADAGDPVIRDAHSSEVRSQDSDNDGATLHLLLKSGVVVLLTIAVGARVSSGITALGVTLPGYIGAMMVAAVIRNIDDATGWIGLHHRTIRGIGTVALSFFLVLALMTLNLRELSALALPLLAILLVQTALVVAVCLWPVFGLMGADYESAVMTSGFAGFMLGITANAMAVMHSLTERFGPAPRAFLVAPLVGAFFLDFINALIITVCLNLAK